MFSYIDSNLPSVHFTQFCKSKLKTLFNMSGLVNDILEIPHIAGRERGMAARVDNGRDQSVLSGDRRCAIRRRDCNSLRAWIGRRCRINRRFTWAIRYGLLNYIGRWVLIGDGTVQRRIEE